jgi:hypothetical protein
VAHRLIRYSAALVLLVYGFAKINGSQFTILDSELDKPMGQVSGFWLTWYYFGFSPFYGTFIALAEIAGAILLTFRRTTLLGACILAPMLVNIILIDISYGVDPGATGVAVLLLAGTVALIVPQRRELMALFWPIKSGAASSAALTSARWGVRLAMLALTFGFTYWVANFNNRAPTPIDGVWDVVQVEPQELAAARIPKMPKTIFFEYNRAHMTVFKTSDGKYTQHHFEVDRNSQRIQIWETRLSKGSQIFDGHYTLAEAGLMLKGTWQDVGEIALRLHRRSVR